jgi:hypothetical protein
MYKLLPNNLSTGTPCGIQCLTTWKIIPFDPDNTDYQEYLKWVSEGNTPEPAEGTE